MAAAEEDAHVRRVIAGGAAALLAEFRLDRVVLGPLEPGEYEAARAQMQGYVWELHIKRAFLYWEPWEVRALVRCVLDAASSSSASSPFGDFGGVDVGAALRRAVKRGQESVFLRDGSDFVCWQTKPHVFAHMVGVLAESTDAGARVWGDEPVWSDGGLRLLRSCWSYLGFVVRHGSPTDVVEAVARLWAAKCASGDIAATDVMNSALQLQARCANQAVDQKRAAALVGALLQHPVLASADMYEIYMWMRATEGPQGPAARGWCDFLLDCMRGGTWRESVRRGAWERRLAATATWWRVRACQLAAAAASRALAKTTMPHTT